jgi:hypothetical protein
MKNFCVVRLGRDSVSDIRMLDSYHESPKTPIQITVHCKQVPVEAITGTYVLLCFGSDNSQGAPTDWVRGLRCLGTILQKTGGPGYNDQWVVGIEIGVVLPESITRKDLLASAPAAYFWCSGIPTIGIEANSQQTIQLVKDEDDDQNIAALFFAVKKKHLIFESDVCRAYPALKDLFDYFPEDPIATQVSSVPKTIVGGDKHAAGENTIYFGPPGTGKSAAIKNRLGSELSIRTQFHPEYTHSDFVGSYRPVVGSEASESKKVVSHDGLLIDRPISYFAFVPGPFTSALEAAYKSPSQVFLVIEEINRGDCAAIFGDIFQLLDRQNSGRSEYGLSTKPELLSYLKTQGAPLDIAGDGKLYIPGNLSILATMNTSDQSLYPMDSAFKRRWNWISCPIKYDELISERRSHPRPVLIDGHKTWDWIELLRRLNSNIVRDRLEDKQIGPWFIKPDKEGVISWDAFVNKCVFYLWHDVFKDEQLSSEYSPFKADGPASFGETQELLNKNGLSAVFRESLLEGIEALK